MLVNLVVHLSSEFF